MKTFAVKLIPTAEKHVKKGHPWVFDRGIKKMNGEPKAGDICVIFDQKKNSFLGLGLYDPDSVIRIKMIQVHSKAKINREWFEQKFKLAKEKRAKLLNATTNSYRLIYGENDGLPSLIVDIYDRVAVLKLYSLIWQPFLDLIIETVVGQSACEAVVLRLSRKVSQGLEDHHDGEVVYGNLVDEEVLFLEAGLRFHANVIRGHKTGFFLDHRQNRIKVGKLSQGKTVLDVFSYAGGFSVHALVGGATEVTSLDISKQALAVAQKNVHLNEARITGKHNIYAVDAFEGLNHLKNTKRTYDLVIIDPPSFAKSEKEIPQALNSYSRLAKLGAALVKQGGMLLLASCSSRISRDAFFEINEQALRSTQNKFQLIEKTFHDDDHPIGFPEGSYLKTAYYRCGI